MDMKIAGAYSQYIAPPVKSHPHSVKVLPKSSAGDRVCLSSQAEDFGTAMRAIHLTPDIRRELVKSIRDMIQNGTYNISAHDVAARILHGLDD